MNPYFKFYPDSVKNKRDTNDAVLMLGAGSRGILTLLNLNFKFNYVVDLFDNTLCDWIKMEKKYKKIKNCEIPLHVYCVKAVLEYFCDDVQFTMKDDFECYEFKDKAADKVRYLTILRKDLMFESTINDLIADIYLVQAELKCVIHGGCVGGYCAASLKPLVCLVKDNCGVWIYELLHFTKRLHALLSQECGVTVTLLKEFMDITDGQIQICKLDFVDDDDYNLVNISL